MSQTIYGIDFGTTNSCLAVMEPGGPRVIEIDDRPIVPSIVSFDRKSGEVVVGQRARNRLMLEPEVTVRSIKRRMGSAEPLTVAGRELAPEEIAAEILRYLKTQGEAALGTRVERAVITVPAYFEDAQRRATIRAGELAGLEVVRLLNEPTAAALVYDRLELRGAGGEEIARRGATDRAERILVYDLGGGTFDVSVVEIAGELNEVRASCGDNHLGGDDFDQLLADHLLKAARDEAGTDLATPPRTLARLNDAAERAKIDLSRQPYVRVTEEALFKRRHLDLEVARRTFEEIVERHLRASMEQVEKALEEAQLEPAEIDRVVLVGGSTRIPRIREMLDERFDCPVEHAGDPALCVALGAAVQGAILGGQVFDHILVDVAAHSLGVKSLGDDWDDSMGMLLRRADTFTTIIRRNTQIPAVYSEPFYTVVDDQERVHVEVFQGESPRCSDNALIGDFLFDLRPAPAGSEVVVELGYDLDGVVRVVVEQRGFDNREEVTLDTRQRATATASGEEAGVGDGGTAGGGAAGGGAVDNYMIRKARALALRLAEGELRGRLESAARAYQAALQRPPGGIEGGGLQRPPGGIGGSGLQGGAGETEVDRLEDALLDALDEAEESLAEAAAPEVG